MDTGCKSLKNFDWKNKNSLQKSNTVSNPNITEALDMHIKADDSFEEDEDLRKDSLYDEEADIISQKLEQDELKIDIKIFAAGNSNLVTSNSKDVRTLNSSQNILPF